MLAYTNDTYNFSFKYNASLKVRYNEDTLISLTDDINSLVMDVIATKREEESGKELSELGVGYVNLLRIYNENIDYSIMNDETIDIYGGKYKARRVDIKVANGDDVCYETAILIPADDREITMVFRSLESNYETNKDKIDKIVKSIIVM